MFNVAGLLLSASGLFVFATVDESSSLAVILTGVVLQSSGSGMFQSPNNSSIFGAADASKHGVVAALVNLTRNSANVTGVAVATAIVTAVMASQGFDANIDDVIESGRETGMLGAFNSGLHIAYVIMGTLLAVGALASAFKGKSRQEVTDLEARSTSEKTAS
jgi:fucose permease